MIPEHRTTTSEWAKLVVGEKKGGEGMLRKDAWFPTPQGVQATENSNPER